MSLSEALLKVLNTEEEPLSKRLKIADNAFHSPELQVRHKEAILLKWIVNNFKKCPNEELGLFTSRWLSSNDFKDLTQNDISNDDIVIIVKAFNDKLLEEGISIIEKQQLIESVLLLCHNKVFQQYFKYNIESYCKLISLSLEGIVTPLKYVDFITKSFLFPKSMIVQEHFCKHFLDILFPVFVKKVLQFENNQLAFNETVSVVNKSILQGNIKEFQSFFELIFATDNEGKEETAIPKLVFKYLSSTLEQTKYTAVTSFKIFVSAFSENFKGSPWLYKFLIFITKLLQFNISKDFNIKIPFKQKTKIKLSKSLSVLLTILDVISTTNFTEDSVSNVSVSEFLKRILETFISINIKSSVAFEIILRCISINPLIIESIIGELIVFICIGNNDKFKDSYEKVVVCIFEVFAKLHRVENLISKIIPALKAILTQKNPLKIDETAAYTFEGNPDIQNPPDMNLSANEIFTQSILECFTRCLYGLASWQIINVLKTMLYHLKNAIADYADDSFDNDTEGCIFLEILGILTNCLLQSTKIADHTIPQNVVVKFVKGLDEMRDILNDFGLCILKRPHNHITMRTFLNLAYIWAEVYMTLAYYSINKEVEVITVVDSSYSAANLRYLHSYMDIKEWQLIVQRITNFGEYPCKKLLQKLFIQKLRAMLLLEKNVNDDITTNIVKTLQSNLDDTWQDLVLDKFTVNFVLPKMDKVSLIFLAEHLVETDQLFRKNHIKDSIILTNAIIYVVMMRINKLFKIKRKHDGKQNKSLSSTIFSLCPDQIFFSSEGIDDITGVLESMTSQYENWENSKPTASSIASKEEKLLSYLGILKNTPFIYCDLNIQRVILLYLFSLSLDIEICSEEARTELEDIILGILQTCKFPLTEIFKIEILGSQAISNFLRHNLLFPLIVDNIFKHEESILKLDPLISRLTKTLEDSKHLNSCFLILQAINKMKRTKMNPSTKEQANKYKTKILSKMAKLACKSDYLIEAYATCLKHYISLEEDQATLKKLLDKLGSYIEYSLNNISDDNKKGCALLFCIVLENKTKIDISDRDIALKIWNACKKIDIGQEYSHLITLIVTLIPNDEFKMLVTDLFDATEIYIQTKNYTQLARQLKTWESILTCNVNPVKLKIWQAALENLMYELLYVLRTVDYEDVLYKNIIHLEQSMIQAQHFMLSPPLVDMFLVTVAVLMRHNRQYFESVYGLSISILEMLLKCRNALIMDRLPAFLQQYRTLLKAITDRSNSDEECVQKLDVKMASDCVHTLEKLTKNLVACKKDMGRIAVFLIADILERYEQINLYPNVKLHLNNCIYSLISLCDHHAVSYLLRVLSNASREMFKIMYEHYKKYYMFTGKV